MVGATPDDPETVVSLVCFRDASRSQVLLGVRRPTPFAARHPAVLSTPTMAVPASVARELLPVAGFTPGLRHFTGTPRFRVGHAGYVDNPHAFVLEHLRLADQDLGNRRPSHLHNAAGPSASKYQSRYLKRSPFAQWPRRRRMLDRSAAAEPKSR